MKLIELLQALTKYYAIVVKDDRGARIYEDQTVVPSGMSKREVETIDFYEDDGDGERLLIRVKTKGDKTNGR